MRLLLDANILLDCLVLAASGQPRPGKSASDQLLSLCDQGGHQGMIAWHTLPIVAYYHEKQHRAAETSAMMDTLLALLLVPSVCHNDAANWKSHGLKDFEDALQVASAMSGHAELIITRNTVDFVGCSLPVMTPEEFLANKPEKSEP